METEWVQSILEEGIEQGLVEGFRKGVERGRREGLLRALTRLAERKLGAALRPPLRLRLEGASAEQLAELTVAVGEAGSTAAVLAALQGAAGV